MDGPAEIDVEHRDGYTAVRFFGSFSVDRYKRQADAASLACREAGTGKLLVDTTCYDLSPSTVERYELATHAVKASAGLKVALLVSPAFLDPNKFGILVAQNRGLAVDAFTEPAKAVEWLLAPPAADPGRN